MIDHPKASIIILTYNNLGYTRQCLESIFARTNELDYELIVVDNASQDGTQAFLQEIGNIHPNVRLILNEKNEGFARGNNIGAAEATGDYIVFLNNDTIVTEGWLRKLITHAQEPGAGIVGPVTNHSGNETRIEVGYQSLDDMEAFAQEYTQHHAGETFEIGMMPFMCVILRREVYERIGPLDERFGIGMFEDDDYAMRLRQKGYRILCAEDVFIHHWGSASFSLLQGQEYLRLFEENRRKYNLKWNIQWEVPLYRNPLIRKQLTESQDWNRELQGQVISLQRELSSVKTELAEIHSSTGWKIVRKAWDIRLAIFPNGSRSERLFRVFMVRGATALRKVRKLWQRGKKDRSRISWYAYLFKRFQQKRNQVCPPVVDGIWAPGKSGLVSIVLPVYNGEKYIRESIDSILSQTYAHYEVIAVDDGSTDRTGAILDEYAQQDPRIRVVHQANMRLPVALNTGFQFAQGEYLTWTSADNRYLPGFLEKMVGCLNRHPDWDMIYANIDLIDTDGQPLKNSDRFGRCQQPPGSEHIFLLPDPSELNTYPDNYVNAAFLYRSRVPGLIGDYSRFRFGTEDYDYWMRINAVLNLRHADFDDVVYEYRFHESSLTSRDQELGITKSRTGLMVFEDARRDFYLSPMAWVVDTDGRSSADVLADRIKEWIQQTGGILLDKADMAAHNGRQLWSPIACVYVTGYPADADIPEYWPENAVKVVLADAGAPLSEETTDRWELCIALGSDLALPVLPGIHRGWLSAASPAAFCSAVDIRTRSTCLSRLEAAIAVPDKTECKISVVICTYRRGGQLADAIRSAAQQSLSPDEYEVIVVNNDPEDHSVTKIVEELRISCFPGRSDRLRLITCPFRGLSYARNAGISEAKGEIVCFLDDDAEAFPDWLEQISKAYQQYPQAGVVGGPVLLVPPQDKLRWLKPGWEHLWSHFSPDYQDARVVDGFGDYPYGANWSARREALLQIGGFRGSYGRKGVDFSGGEEVVAAVLIQKSDYQVVVAPAAKVNHKPAADRFTFAHVRNTLLSIMMTEYHQQIDLYLPMEMSLQSLKKARSMHILQAILSPLSDLHERVKNVLYAWSYHRVLKQLLKNQKEMEFLSRSVVE